MKKIKILRIIARLNIGGPAIHTILLTEGLDKTRFESLLISGSISKDEGDMSYYGRSKNLVPIFVPELKRELNFFDDISAFRKIYNIIKAEQPDIIHTHTAKAGTLGRLAGILCNLTYRRKSKPIKLIHTFHGHIFEGYFSKFKTQLFIFIERILAIFTCKIITVSESLKKELISLDIAKPGKIEVIPLGLELESFFRISPKDNSISNIGIVGRLVPIKNHHLFLEAAAKIITADTGIKLKFKIIGDGQLRKELEAYVRTLNLDGWVDFLGWQKDLINIYQDLDIVALTSINEGTPVSLIEAMASAKATVATDVGGVKDLLGEERTDSIELNHDFKVLERGVMVRSGDCAGFAAALTFLLQNGSLRQDMGMRARDFVRNRFTKERLVKDVELLYETLVKSD